jgi:hypothetical protein
MDRVWVGLTLEIPVPDGKCNLVLFWGAKEYGSGVQRHIVYAYMSIYTYVHVFPYMAPLYMTLYTCMYI